MSLPAPDSDALAASQALQQLIAAEIAQQGGALPFARFMELALYAPGLDAAAVAQRARSFVTAWAAL